MRERCAVVGIGQTNFKKRRDDVSIAGLLREAIDRALVDAELTLKDVDAVVIGTAPDAFEGIVMPVNASTHVQPSPAGKRVRCSGEYAER